MTQRGRNGSAASFRSPDEGGDGPVASANSAEDTAKAQPLDANAATPTDVWNDYFAKRKPRDEDVRRVCMQLNEARKFEHLEALIEAALRHNQSQPWMFPVLASTKKYLGRPEEDVERVLLSQVDLSGTDVHSMVYSGAYLTRFGAERKALELYRQASQVEPTRPEPYVLGLKLAVKLKDADSIRWAACGILINAWTKDHERLHRAAEDAAADAIRSLRQSGQTAQADAFAAAIAEAHQRDLVLKLSWVGQGDLDLIVEEPWGTICSLDNPQSTGGGVLVHDGSGPDPDDCFDEYVCALGAPGYYRVRIRHVWGEVVGKRARLEVIRYQGMPNESREVLTVPLAAEDATVRISVREGRRAQRLRIAKTPDPAVSQLPPKSRRGLRDMVGPMGDGQRKSGRRFGNSRRGGGTGQTGFTPIVSWLSEGASLSAMAMVSGDRRYVRLSLQPSFNQITDVFTFSFINNGNPNGGGGGGGIRGN